MRTTNRIAPQTHVAGGVHAHDDLVVEGHIVGELSGSSTVTVAQDAIVEANVHVRKLVVHGVIVGHIAATDSVHIGPRAQIRGDIRTPQLTLEEGGRIRGRVKTGVTVESPRPPRSSTKTKARGAPAASKIPDATATESTDATDEGTNILPEGEQPTRDDVPSASEKAPQVQEDGAQRSEGQDTTSSEAPIAKGEVVEVDDDEPEAAPIPQKHHDDQSA